MNKGLKTLGLIFSILLIQIFTSIQAEAQAAQCVTRTTDNNNGEFRIDIEISGGGSHPDCRFGEFTYDVLSGTAKLISESDYTLVFDDSRNGSVNILVTKPTPFESQFDIGGSPVQCGTRTTDNNDGQFIIEFVSSGGENHPECKFTKYTYKTLSGTAQQLISPSEYKLIFDDTLTGSILIDVTEPTPFETQFDIGGSPSAEGTISCFTRTTDNNDGEFTIELTGGNGQRTTDCRFYKWHYDTLSGEAKNIATNQYEVTFDDTLNGTINIVITEPTPFESTFMIGGSSAKTTNGNTAPLPPAGYEDEVLTEFENNPFPDTAINDLEGKAAAELYRRAVIGGFPDGEFKGTRNVNRAEAAKFLLLARGTQVQELVNNGKFWDVKEGEWYVKYVMTAESKGIIKGHPDGSFKPADNVNTAEFIKMLTLAFNLQTNLSHSYSDVQSSDWFEQYAGTAKKYNLFPKRTAGKLQPSRHLSRNEVAVAIYQYLSNR